MVAMMVASHMVNRQVAVVHAQLKFIMQKKNHFTMYATHLAKIFTINHIQTIYTKVFKV